MSGKVRVYSIVKRSLDICLSLALLALTAPLFAVIALLIRKESPGPVFYQGLRVGKDGRPFRMLKFRTMVVNADKIGGPSTPDDDPRITRTGRWLRKHKLDELPQLINVLKGDMSFVGPRPEVPQYVELFTEEERAILTMRPGITDWASLWNCDEGAVLAGSPDPEKTYLEKIRPHKVRLQLEYVRKASLCTDILIALRTVYAVLVKAKPRALEAIAEEERR